MMQNNQEVKTVSSYEHSMRPVQIDNHIDLAGKMLVEVMLVQIYTDLYRAIPSFLHAL